jgi:hypothetical protein
MAAKSNVVISEGQVTFKRVEGHKHDGLTSSLIDTSKYSMFDFIATENAKDASRAAKQQNNKNTLKTFIISTIEGRVLNPEGIRIQANAISAREIIAGTITADELSSNIVLVNNVIRSNNFINNTDTKTGWAIYSNGTGIFNNIQIRGNLVAGTGVYANTNTPIFANIGGYFSLGSNFAWNGNTLTIKGTLQFPDGSTPGTFDNGDSLTGGSIGGIVIGNSSIRSTDYDANPTTAGFAIFSDGTAVFNEVAVRGAIYATTGNISGTVTIGTETATAVSGAVTTASSAASAAAAAQATADSKINNTQVNGNVTSISGGVITTGTINLNNVNVRTGTSGARINIDSTGLYAYNADGTQTVKIGSDGSAAFTGTITGSTVTSGDGTNGIQITSDGYLIGTGGNGVRVKNVAGETGTKLFGNLIYTQTLRTNEIDSFDGGDYMRVGRESSTGGFRVKVSEALYDVTSTADKRNVAVNNSNILVTTNLSSIRYKTNVNKLNIDYKKILKLEPVSFLYKKEFLLEGDDETILQYGLIAEEVEKAGLESLVQYNNQNEPNGVDYARLPVYLLLVCKELQLKIEELEARIQTLEGV